MAGLHSQQSQPNFLNLNQPSAAHEENQRYAAGSVDDSAVSQGGMQYSMRVRSRMDAGGGY